MMDVSMYRFMDVSIDLVKKCSEVPVFCLNRLDSG